MMYDVLASYYDALVEDAQARDAWIELIEANIRGRSILDAACGSGDIAIELSRRGYAVTAFDCSEQMLAAAREKADSDRVHWQLGDLRQMPDGTYDAIVCLCDSFNYLLSEEEVRHFFAQCQKRLSEAGVLIVDMHSMDRLAEFAEEYNETGVVNGHDYQWTIESEDDRIYQSFAFYENDGSVQLEQHVQRVYAPEWIAEQLTACGLVFDVKTDFVKEGVVPGEKQFYICRRKQR